MVVPKAAPAAPLYEKPLLGPEPVVLWIARSPFPLLEPGLLMNMKS